MELFSISAPTSFPTCPLLFTSSFPGSVNCLLFESSFASKIFPACPLQSSSFFPKNIHPVPYRYMHSSIPLDHQREKISVCSSSSIDLYIHLICHLHLSSRILRILFFLICKCSSSIRYCFQYHWRDDKSLFKQKARWAQCCFSKVKSASKGLLWAALGCPHFILHGICVPAPLVFRMPLLQGAAMDTGWLLRKVLQEELSLLFWAPLVQFADFSLICGLLLVELEEPAQSCFLSSVSLFLWQCSFMNPQL